jgi:hypothetical protein
MANNRGKDFENVVKDCMLKVCDVDVQRLYDTTSGFIGVKQPSDFIIYKYPYQYYLECKSTNSGTLHKDYITQLDALAEKSKTKGIVAGVIIWFIQHDVTVYVPVDTLIFHFYNRDKKSVSVKDIISGDFAKSGKYFLVKGNKRRVFFDYDFKSFFKEIEAWKTL